VNTISAVCPAATAVDDGSEIVTGLPAVAVDDDVTFAPFSVTRLSPTNEIPAGSDSYTLIGVADAPVPLFSSRIVYVTTLPGVADSGVTVFV
jgi:hypothetical protein